MTGDEAEAEVAATRRRGRPPAHRGADTETRLLDAARLCFCRKGYAATSMSEIAGEAGVTARAIYHYVNSKSVLFARAVEATYARFVDEVVAQVLAPPHETTRSRLRAYTEVIRGLYREDPSLVAFLSVAVLETERHPELQGALPPALHDDVPSFNKMLVTEAVARDELAPGVEPAGAITLLDVLGLGVTVVASKEQPKDYLAMLDVLDRLLDGSLFASARPATQDASP